jgi:glycerol-3-phosphate O-acyltransferase
VDPDARMSLDLAKNGIVQFFVPRALIATSVLAAPGPPIVLAMARERVLSLSRLFKYEFMFRADATFERIFDEEVAAMIADGELARLSLGSTEGAVGIAPHEDDGRKQIDLYARLLENFVEGYRVAARGLAVLLRGPLASRDVVRRAITTGRRMFLAGEIGRPEAVSRPALENAYASFVDQGYIARSDDKLSLTESYETASEVATIESRIEALGPSARVR